MVGKVGSGDGVSVGLSVLSGAGVAVAWVGCGVQVGAKGEPSNVGVSVGSSISLTSVGNGSSCAMASGANVGRGGNFCHNVISGILSGATKKSTIPATTTTETSSSSAAATLINRPIHPDFCLRFVAMLL